MSQQYVKAEYLLSDVTARIIAAATKVHRTLGPGFEQVVYQRALALELPAHNWRTDHLQAFQCFSGFKDSVI